VHREPCTRAGQGSGTAGCHPPAQPRRSCERETRGYEPFERETRGYEPFERETRGYEPLLRERAKRLRALRPPRGYARRLDHPLFLITSPERSPVYGRVEGEGLVTSCLSHCRRCCPGFACLRPWLRSPPGRRSAPPPALMWKHL